MKGQRGVVASAGNGVVNNIDVRAVRMTKKKLQGGHYEIEKVMDGEYHLEGRQMYTAEVNSERSGFVLSSDDPTVLGGKGTHLTPLTFVLFGAMACLSSTIAIQSALKGIKIGKLKLHGNLSYDIGPELSGIDAPLAKKLRIVVESDRDLREIIKGAKTRCPAVFAIANPIETEIVQA